MHLINLFPRQLRAVLWPRRRITKARPIPIIPKWSDDQIADAAAMGGSTAVERSLKRDLKESAFEKADGEKCNGDTKARPNSCRKITGRQMGLILCDALGESPKNVQCIEVVADAREGAIVKITRFVSDSEAGILGSLMREFSLVEAEEVEQRA